MEGEVEKVRVLIVDGYPAVRIGHRQVISEQPDLAVCGEAAGLPEALLQVGQTHPHLVLSEIPLNQGNGFELIQRIKTDFSGVRILIVSSLDELWFAERVLHAGAGGYLHKSEPPERLIAAVRAVLLGELYASSAVMARLLDRAASRKPSGTSSPLGTLSERELEVFQFISQGLETAQIASRLALRLKTVESYRDNVRKKLGLESSSELIRYAAQCSLGSLSGCWLSGCWMNAWREGALERRDLA